ncbi:MAG: alpha/beta hydrolase [Chitinivibrionales bacterium]|nr:alpha/beta hydrolase [Chitinivibrionales bacterium]
MKADKTKTVSAGEREVDIGLEKVTLHGNLSVPEGARGIVLFAHGSGSSRHSPRNRFVAGSLVERGIGALLFDLLTSEEEVMDNMTGQLRFDIDLLADRLKETVSWVKNQGELKDLNIGYFGASTGAAAALMAAAQEPENVKAIVSRGGRADMPANFLPRVQAPVLLLVGGNDPVIIDMNKFALKKLHCTSRMDIIPGATHLFEEPGALEKVAELAGKWFDEYL